MNSRVAQISQFSTISKGDSFTFIARTIVNGQAVKDAIILESPIDGMIGFCSGDVGPKDWQPGGIWPKNFRPLHPFAAPCHLTIAYAGSFHEISPVLHSGQVGVFKVKKARMKTRPSGSYSYGE